LLQEEMVDSGECLSSSRSEEHRHRRRWAEMDGPDGREATGQGSENSPWCMCYGFPLQIFKLGPVRPMFECV